MLTSWITQYTPSRKTKSKKLNASQHGNALAIGAIILGVMLMIGLSVGNSSTMSTQELMGNRVASQLMYLSYSGIQEAIARRFFPRTNAGGFSNTAKAFKSDANAYLSGWHPNNVEIYANTVGIYRYMVLGGDFTQSKNGNYYPAGEMQFYESVVNNLNNANNDRMPFIVVSQASLCESSINQIEINGITTQNNGQDPTCNTTGSTKRTLTAVAVIDTYVKPNRITSINYFYSNNIQLPYPTTIPGNIETSTPKTIVNSIVFDDVWNQLTSYYSALVRSVGFYPASAQFDTDDYVYRELDQATNYSTLSINTPVEPDSLIRIAFEGAYTPHSMYGVARRNCENDVFVCSIHLEELDDSNNVVKTFDGFDSVVPVMPYSNHVLIIPRFGGWIGMLPGTKYRLIIRRFIKDAYTQASNPEYQIVVFKTSGEKISNTVYRPPTIPKKPVKPPVARPLRPPRAPSPPKPPKPPAPVLPNILR
ncbi:MAG: hypothetical protein VKJ06_06925 [Vampirovibrionales bacterium]|nr:hypothetical protein [Vampirovibrionales bacterium]